MFMFVVVVGVRLIFGRKITQSTTRGQIHRERPSLGIPHSVYVWNGLHGIEKPTHFYHLFVFSSLSLSRSDYKISVVRCIRSTKPHKTRRLDRIQIQRWQMWLWYVLVERNEKWQQFGLCKTLDWSHLQFTISTKKRREREKLLLLEYK